MYAVSTTRVQYSTRWWCYQFMCSTARSVDTHVSGLEGQRESCRPSRQIEKQPPPGPTECGGVGQSLQHLRSERAIRSAHDSRERVGSASQIPKPVHEPVQPAPSNAHCRCSAAGVANCAKHRQLDVEIAEGSRACPAGRR